MDKTYLNDSLHKMADYLSTHGYEQPINLKTLSRPSGRDFKNIMGFLFRQIDPSYVVSDILLLDILYLEPLSGSSDISAVQNIMYNGAISSGIQKAMFMACMNNPSLYTAL